MRTCAEWTVFHNPMGKLVMLSLSSGYWEILQYNVEDQFIFRYMVNGWWEKHEWDQYGELVSIEFSTGFKAVWDLINGEYHIRIEREGYELVM